MSDLTAKFTTLEEQLTSEADGAHTQRESIITTLEDIQLGIASVNSDLLLMKRALLMAMSQVDPCVTCPPPSLITPPTSPTHHPINADKCKRVQAFLNALHEITGVFGAATDSGIFWSPSIVISGITEVITTLITGGTIPLPSFTEAASIAGAALTYGVSNIGRNDNLQDQFDSISSGMLSGMYDTTNPAAVQDTYASFVDASSLPSDEKALFKALAFNDLFTFFFDPASTPDLSPYDGTICATGLCFVFTVDEMVSGTGEFGPYVIPDWSKYGIEAVSLPGQSHPVWTFLDWGSATWDSTGYASVYKQMQAYPESGTTDEVGAFPSFPGDNWATFVSTTPFAITICRDG